MAISIFVVGQFTNRHATEGKWFQRSETTSVHGFLVPNYRLNLSPKFFYFRSFFRVQKMKAPSRRRLLSRGRNGVLVPFPFSSVLFPHCYNFLQLPSEHCDLEVISFPPLSFQLLLTTGLWWHGQNVLKRIFPCYSSLHLRVIMNSTFCERKSNHS